jgi:hypothetical protein
MLQELTDLPSGLVGVKAVGTVTKQDYEQVLEPMLARAEREHRRLRFLYELGPELEAFTPDAAWEDMRVGLGSLRLLDGCAVVTDVDWIRSAVALTRFMFPCPVRAFASAVRERAKTWLLELPENPSLVAHLLPDAGVLVIEVQHALRGRDFETLAKTVDPWIQSHGALHGVVVHAHTFPGWENLPSFLQHVRFLLGHQREIKRLAFAVDGMIAHIAPRVADILLKPEVKAFGYGDLSSAVAWARDGARDAAPARATS